MQTQSKDNHLKQLGEVEQRFGTVSRQCTTLKQAQHRLQQNGTIHQSYTSAQETRRAIMINVFAQKVDYCEYMR